MGNAIMKKKWIATVAMILIVAVASMAFAQDDAPKYHGSKKSDKYHNADCRYVEKIKAENLITFHSVKEARDAGYKPCKVCKPPSEDAPQKNKRRRKR